MSIEANKSLSKSVLNSAFLKSDQLPSYEISMRQQKMARKVEREKTKGKEWYNMPAGEMTEEIKNDLSIIKMRGGLHKDRFYKSNDTDELPKYFQVKKNQMTTNNKKKKRKKINSLFYFYFYFFFFYNIKDGKNC